jgi:hypothetical protein
MKEKHACKNDTPEKDNHRFVQSSSSNVQKLRWRNLPGSIGAILEKYGQSGNQGLINLGKK